MGGFSFGRVWLTATAAGCNERRERLFLLGAIILAVLAVYYPVARFEFINYDDPGNVYDNRLITNFSPDSLLRFWSSSYEALYIPLTYTLWGLLARVAQLLPGSEAGLNPLPFHLANLVLHIGSTLLVGRLLRQCGATARAAAAGALLFALHPLQVEPVAWVTGFKDLLSGFLALLAIHYYLRHALAGREGGAAWRSYGLACSFLALALLAKPSTVTVPLLAGALGYFCAGRPLRRLAVELLPMLALTIPLIVVTSMAQPQDRFPLHLDYWQRLLLASDSLGFYLGKLFWPAVLGPDYGRMPLAVLNDPQVYLVLIVPAAMAAAFFWWRRQGWPQATILLFALALLPVLGLLPFNFQKLSTVADRYMYLAMLGPALLLARGWDALPWRAARLAVIVLLLGLAVRGGVLVGAWRDSFSFCRLALEVNPSSYNIYNHLGAAHERAGNLQEAEAAYRYSIAISPFAPDAYCNLGILQARGGRHREALDNFSRALPLHPHNLALLNILLGDEYRTLGDSAAARNSYARALAINPGLADELQRPERSL